MTIFALRSFRSSMIQSGIKGFVGDQASEFDILDQGRDADGYRGGGRVEG